MTRTTVPAILRRGRLQLLLLAAMSLFLLASKATGQVSDYRTLWEYSRVATRAKAATTAAPVPVASVPTRPPIQAATGTATAGRGISWRRRKDEGVPMAMGPLTRPSPPLRSPRSPPARPQEAHRTIALPRHGLRPCRRPLLRRHPPRNSTFN